MIEERHDQRQNNREGFHDSDTQKEKNTVERKQKLCSKIEKTEGKTRFTYPRNLPQFSLTPQ
jgi:hypothetical protein